MSCIPEELKDENNVCRAMQVFMCSLDIPINPYMEKWSPGRPTKAAKKQRELAIQWNMENNMPKGGFLQAMINRGDAVPVSGGKPRKVLVKYVQRKQQ